MATQISLKRCVKREEEEVEELEKKQCLSSSSMIQRQSWSDLDSDLLREINKKLPCNYADAIGFRGVCKTWRAAGHVKLAGDVLPWTLMLGVDINSILRYKLCEPKSFRSLDTVPIVSNAINLKHYIKDTHTLPELVRYVDGWLHIALHNYLSNILHFLFFCVTTKAPPIILPQLNDVVNLPVFLALSTNTPDSPDCVFVTVSPIDDYTRRIAIFRQCDTHWTITHESLGGRYRISRHLAAMSGFIRGVLYFCSTEGIASYDFATGALKVDHFAKEFNNFGVCGFFELDGDLVLAYYEKDTNNLCISKYDWMKKVWVPLRNLGSRYLYLNNRGSAYVDHINYYGILSANKIYVGGVTNDVLRVEEYTFKYAGRPSKCSSPQRALVHSIGPTCYPPSAMWVSPPHLLNNEWSGGSCIYMQ